MVRNLEATMEGLAACASFPSEAALLGDSDQDDDGAVGSAATLDEDDEVSLALLLRQLHHIRSTPAVMNASSARESGLIHWVNMDSLSLPMRSNNTLLQILGILAASTSLFEGLCDENSTLWLAISLLQW